MVVPVLKLCCVYAFYCDSPPMLTRLRSYSIPVSGAKTVAAQLKVLGIFDVKFKVAATWQGKELHFSLSVLACAFDHCLPELPVIRNVKFLPHSRSKRSVEGMNQVLGCFSTLFLNIQFTYIQTLKEEEQNKGFTTME